MKSSASVAVDPIGQIFGSYRVVSKISEGGMGAVFVAEHLLIGRRIALKLLLRHVSSDSNAAQRFLNEARAVNAIRHPHIVDITDVGTTPAGEYFLAMELLEGQTLSDRRRRLGLGAGGLAVIGAAVAAVLTLRAPPLATVAARREAPAPAVPAPARPQPTAIPEPPPPQDVKLILRSDPPGAEVRLEGEPRVVGITPTELRIVRGESERTYVISKHGYRDETQTIVPSTDQDVVVKLVASTTRPAKAPPPGDRPSQKALENPWAE